MLPICPDFAFNYHYQQINPTFGRTLRLQDKAAKIKPPIRPRIKPYMKNLNSIMPNCAFLLLNMEITFFGWDDGGG